MSANFDGEQKAAGGTPQKILDVIVVRNRQTPQQNPACFDVFNSGFKQTEVDPLEHVNFSAPIVGEENYWNLMRRVSFLESKVRYLENLHPEPTSERELSRRKDNKRNRRPRVEIELEFSCTKCAKLYGSQTSLKHHLKIKHPIQEPSNNA